jgi:CheY-like chemotaxis protein
VPIVALSGGEPSAEWGFGMACGMNGVLTKPVRPAELFDTIAAIVGPPALPVVPATLPPPAAGLRAMARLTDLQRDLPDGLFASLAEQCFSDIRLRLPRLHQALARGDAAGVSNEAHALAGMAGSYGLAGFERRPRDIMRLAAAGDLPAAAGADIDGEFNRDADELRTVLRARAA